MASGVDDPVVVVPYDETWPSLFEVERARIERAIGPWALEIEHVGSTAVPGLAAKPVIDIMVGVRSLEDSPVLVERLTGIGYEYVPELELQIPFRRYFRKLRAGRRTHQIHLVERSNSEWWDRHMLFRDYLRAHPEVAEKYARLKQELSGRFEEDRMAYTDAKTGFISEVVRRAEEGEQG
ncbi:MAG: GrpB family protein [Actinomycetota bacterium]|nr:GrpB family protein [Actinomycetota bacterium]